MEKDKKVNEAIEEVQVTEVQETPDAPIEAEVVATSEEDVPAVGRVKTFWSKKFPEKTYENDDEFDGMLADYLESSDVRLNRLEEAEKTFRQVASNHPELLDMVEDLADDPDMTLAEALYNHVDDEEWMPEEGAPDFERMRKARQGRKDREKEAAEYRKKLADNLAVSEGVIKKYFEDNEVSEEEQKAIGEFIDELLGGVVENRITPETMDAFRRARNYDRDIAEAKTVGEIKGKNAKIDAERERKKQETDGLPSAGSAAGVKAKAPIERDFLDEVIDRSNARNDWWK